MIFRKDFLSIYLSTYREIYIYICIGDDKKRKDSRSIVVESVKEEEERRSGEGKKRIGGRSR